MVFERGNSEPASLAKWFVICTLASAASVCLAGEPKPETPDKETKDQGTPEGPTIAELGDIKIKASTIWRIERAHIRQHNAVSPNKKLSERERAELRKKIVFKEIEMALLEQFVKEHKLKVTKAESDSRLAGVKTGLAKKNERFEDFLEGIGKTEDQFRRTSDAILAVEKELRNHVSRKEVERAFAERRDELPLRRCAHILYAYKGSLRSVTTRGKADALKAAKGDLKRIRENGAVFGQLAKDVSDCPSKARSGDLGFTARNGEMVEPFAAAVYALEKVSEVSEVVETDFGFHIIKLTGRRTLADYEERLKEVLVRRKFDSFMQQMRGMNLKKAKFNQDLLLHGAPDGK